MKSNLSIFFLLLLMLFMSILRSHCKTQDHEDLWLLKVDTEFSFLPLGPIPFDFCILSSLFSLCLWLSSCLSITWRNFSFPIQWSFDPCWKLISQRCLGLFLVLQFYSICLYIYPYVVPHCLDYCGFVVTFSVRKYKSSKSALLFQNCFN